MGIEPAGGVILTRVDQYITAADQFRIYARDIDRGARPGIACSSFSYVFEDLGSDLFGLRVISRLHHDGEIPIT